MAKRALNLGCGRMIFPTTRDNPFAQHVMYAIDMACPEALDPDVGWVNVDRVKNEGVDVQCNLFRYGWRATDLKTNHVFSDNQYDVIWCSHIVEHIPHDIRLNSGIPIGQHGYYGTPNAAIRQLYNEDKDGWFAFFYECWRILKPTGRLHILCPYGFSAAGISDPTHTRYITPGTFSYFAKNPDAPFDYELPFEFKTAFKDDGVTPLTNMKVTLDASAIAEEASKYDMLHDEESNQKFAALQQKLQEMISYHVGYIEELFYSFEPVGK